MNSTVSSQPNINGFLKDRSQWNENVASKLAEREGVTLTEKHWDIIHYLRTEFYSNGGIVPLMREIKFNMEKEWNTQISDVDLDMLFPGGVNAQGAKIAGCTSMGTVADLLSVKGGVVWSVTPDRTVGDALSLMFNKNIGSVMVIEDDHLVGLVSERDITRHFVEQDSLLADSKVTELMTTNVISVPPEEALEQCMSLMIENGFRHLPVLDDGRIVGVLSMPDLVKIVVEQQNFTISQLQNNG